MITTNTVRPQLGKAKLQQKNMLEVTKVFGKGVNARVSSVVFAAKIGDA